MTARGALGKQPPWSGLRGPIQHRVPTPSRYTVVQGSFTVFDPDAPRSGPELDGDTVTFVPRNPAVVRGLTRYGAIGP
jgi:hypothetical protein